MEIPEKYHFVSFYRSINCVNTLDSDLYIMDCGIENCVPGKKYGPFFQKGYRIQIILSGQGVFRMNKQSRKLSAGQILILPNGVKWECQADKKNPWQYAWITVDGRNVLSCLKNAGFVTSPVRDCNCTADRFVKIIEEILSTTELTLSNELRRNSCLCELLALLVETKTTKREECQGGSQDSYVQSAIQYIHQNYDHIKVNDIASYIGINRSYLTSIFKSKLKVSPQEYLVNYRLNKGKQLLQMTNQSIQEIALQIGYENPLTFSKMFKNTYGISPRYYRQSVQKEELSAAAISAPL